MVKLVIWDFDGVLINSIQNIKNIMKAIFKENGLEYNEPSLNKTGVSKRYYENFKKGLLDKGIKKQDIISYEGFLYKGKSHPEFKENKDLLITENIAILKENTKNGILNALGTNSNKKRILSVLKDIGIEQYFDLIQTSCDVENPKPHPEFILSILKELNIEPQEAVFIDDNKEVIYAGVDAGIKTILYCKDDYQDNNIDFILDDLRKIDFKKI